GSGGSSLVLGGFQGILSCLVRGGQRGGVAGGSGCLCKQGGRLRRNSGDGRGVRQGGGGVRSLRSLGCRGGGGINGHRLGCAGGGVGISQQILDGRATRAYEG